MDILQRNLKQNGISNWDRFSGDCVESSSGYVIVHGKIMCIENLDEHLQLPSYQSYHQIEFPKEIYTELIDFNHLNQNINIF